MIPESYIAEWAQLHPWSTDAMVEQDLIICRAVQSIFADSFLQDSLAFRGGTALNKLYLHPQPRYSEDIDLVQIHPGPIRQLMDHLRDALSFLGDPKTKSTPMSNKLIYRVDAEDPMSGGLRLKIEINCREHFHVLPWHHVPFALESSWHSGQCAITTYRLEELLGTKLRALYQRKKGRDLFDLYHALTSAAVSPELILQSFCKYMQFSAQYIPTTREFMLNMEEKLQHPDFLADTAPILSPGIIFDPLEAYPLIADTLIQHIDQYRS